MDYRHESRARLRVHGKAEPRRKLIDACREVQGLRKVWLAEGLLPLEAAWAKGLFHPGSSLGRGQAVETEAAESHLLVSPFPPLPQTGHRD